MLAKWKKKEKTFTNQWQKVSSQRINDMKWRTWKVKRSSSCQKPSSDLDLTTYVPHMYMSAQIQKQVYFEALPYLLLPRARAHSGSELKTAWNWEKSNGPYAHSRTCLFIALASLLAPQCLFLSCVLPCLQVNLFCSLTSWTAYSFSFCCKIVFLIIWLF